MPDTGKNPLKIRVLILAAGRSSRMGRVKPLLPLLSASEDCPREGTALALLAALYRSLDLSDITVVTGFHADVVEREAERLGLAHVRNTEAEKGMFSSIRTGLSFLRRNAKNSSFLLVVHPADVPLVRPMSIMALLRACEAEGESTPPVLLPSFAGKKGHPPVIAPHLFEAIERSDASLTLERLLAEFPLRLVPVADACVLYDMDTASEYQSLCRRAGRRFLLGPREALELLRIMAVPVAGLNYALRLGGIAAALGDCLKRAGKGEQLRLWLAMSAGIVSQLAQSQPALLSSLALAPMEDVINRRSHQIQGEEVPFTEGDLISLAENCVTASAFSFKGPQSDGEGQTETRLLAARFRQVTGFDPDFVAERVIARKT